MEVIHKRVKQQGPPKVNRCGLALAPVCELLKQVLRPPETLEKTHMDWSTPGATRFCAVGAKAGSVRELATMEWAVDGEVVVRRASRRMCRRT